MSSFKVLLINLDRSPERLERCTRTLTALGLPWERIAGVDGALLDPDYLQRINPCPPPSAQWFRALTAGEIGCFLSHLKCWHTILDQNLDAALILEDDFDTESACRSDVLHYLGTQAADWDIIKMTRLGQHSSVVCSIAAGIELRRNGHGPVDCTAYMVSRQGAQKLTKQRQHLYRPVDFDLKHIWERDLTLYSLSPNFFRQQSHEEAPSIIGDRSRYRHYPLAQKAQVYLRKHRYHVRFWLAKHLGLGQLRIH